MKKIQYVNSDYYKLCCLVWKYVGNYVNCYPSSSIFRICSNLLSNNMLRSFFWIFGLFGTFANFLSIIFLIKSHGLSNIYHLLLAIGDFFSSSYFLIVACIDLYFYGEYLENENNFKNSILCQFIGILISSSLLLSCTSILLITLERHRMILKPLNISIFSKYKLIFSISNFFCSISINIIPVLFFKVFF